jgi:predicted MPP superfamily phosphohydrolase
MIVARVALVTLALLGHVALLVLGVNLAHAFNYNSSRLDLATLLFLALGTVAGLTFAIWLAGMPAASWPWWAILLLVPSLVTSLAGLPIVTLARHLRRLPYAEGRHATDLAFTDAQPKASAIGTGWRSRILALPGNDSLRLRLEEWDVAAAHLPAALDGLELLLVADIHLTHAYRPAFFEWALDQVAGWRPDAILLLGDVVDDPACYDWIVPLLSRLPAATHRFAILGNHDNLYDALRIAAEIREAGFEVLDGAWATIEHRGHTIAIGGTYHPWGPQPPFGEHPGSEATILLSHTPDFVYRAAQSGVDLMLSGHNHGGQVRLPILGPVFMPSRYSRRFEWGFYREDPTLLYASRGLGAQIPLRYRCPPELTRLRIRVPTREEAGTFETS